MDPKKSLHSTSRKATLQDIGVVGLSRGPDTRPMGTAGQPPASVHRMSILLLALLLPIVGSLPADKANR